VKLDELRTYIQTLADLPGWGGGPPPVWAKAPALVPSGRVVTVPYAAGTAQNPLVRYWGGYSPATLPNPEWDVPAPAAAPVCECGVDSAPHGGLHSDWCPKAGAVAGVPAQRWP
jgi:hypothetical protein